MKNSPLRGKSPHKLAGTQMSPSFIQEATIETLLIHSQPEPNGETPMTMEAFLKKIGQNVNRFRKMRGLTQRDAAKISQISYRYFQKIESGTANITVGTLFRLVALLDIHVCDLLPEKNEPAV